MKMSVRPELTTAPPARVRDMRHTDGAVDNSALLPNHPGSTYKSGNAVQTAGATSDNTKAQGDQQRSRFSFGYQIRCATKVKYCYRSPTTIIFILFKPKK